MFANSAEIRVFILVLTFIIFIQCDKTFGQTADTDTSITIQFGSLSAPTTSVDWIKGEVARFKAKYPKINVELMNIDSPVRENSPLTQEQPLAKNIIGIDSSMGYEIPYLVERGELVPIEQFLPDPEFDPKVFYKNDLEAARYQGKTWGIPWLTNTEVLVCEWGLFTAAGLDHPPKTWDELMNFAQLLTRGQNFAGRQQVGLRLSISNDTVPMMLLSYILQADGSLMSGGKFNLNHPSIKAGLDYFHKLAFETAGVRIDSKSLREALDDPLTLYAMHIVPIEEIGDIMNRNNLLITPLPMAGKEVVACRRRLYLAIRKSTPAEEAASWKLVRRFADPGISLPSRFEGYPCVRTILKRHDFLTRISEGPQHAEVIYTAAQYAVDPGEPAINRAQGFHAIWEGFTPLLMGQKIPEEGFQKLTDSANKLLNPVSASK